MSVGSFWEELRRRHVVRVGVAYVVGSAAVGGGAEVFLSELAPNWVLPTVLWLLILGFPLALALAWAYDLTPEGIRRAESGRALSRDEAATVRARKSIVVLPFHNMSPDPNDAYFSDGLTEEIITHLSRLRSLRVISLSSAMALKASGKDVRTIGRELEVGFVLEGSVRKAGDDLRITAQLIDAEADEHLWAERYDGILDDVFDMQESTSRSIVEALELRLDPSERERLSERPIGNVQAYECLLRSRREAFKGTEEGLRRARRDLEMAMEILGENELLLGGLAEVHLQMYAYGVAVDDETLDRVQSLADELDGLQPESAIVHYLRGRLEANRGSTSAAITHLARAVALDPNHTGQLVFLIDAYASWAGRPDLAEPLAKRLADIDPLTPLSVFIVGYHHHMAGRLDEALIWCDRALELEPEVTWMTLYPPYILLWMGRGAEAVERLERIIGANGPEYCTEWATLLRRSLDGDTDGALEALSDATRAFFWKDPDLPWIMASTYSLAGAKDEALKWLGRAVDRGWINYPLFATQDPLLEGIRGEERFEKLLSDVKGRWESFQAMQ